MKNGITLTALIFVAAIVAVVSCRRSEIRVALIDVPEMSGDRDIRIVTNAALDEVVGQYDGIHNECQVDLTRKIVLYHESQRLLSPAYQRRIEARIAEAGFKARVTNAGLNPPAPVPTVEGPKKCGRTDSRRSSQYLA